MTGQQTAFRRAKSMAGAALIGYGFFALHQNLAAAILQLRMVLDANGSEAFGVPSAVIQAISQISQAYAADQRGFLEGFLLLVLISFWPLLLVMVGTLLSRDSLMDDFEARQKKDGGLVELSAGGSTWK
jgi:hypothetical protein